MLQTTNWLVANPKASVVAFDVARHFYTAAAINAIYDIFPKRTVSLIAGDSTTSIPSFIRLTGASEAPGFKCNIIFIDGSHDYTPALLDIQNMRHLANQSFHRVIIDDGTYPDVALAYQEAVRTDIFQVKQMKTFNLTSCTQWKYVHEGIFAGSYSNGTLSDEDCDAIKKKEQLGQDILVMGEYLF
jgi:hypothetical protein